MKKTVRRLSARQEILFPSNVPKTVTFTGGLGAQILSLAIVHNLRRQNIDVAVDLSYFNMTPRVASTGESYSIWEWQLGPIGIELDQVEKLATSTARKLPRLEDSPEKFSLGMQALQNSAVREKFPEPETSMTATSLQISEDVLLSPFIAMHLRRGDYLNVSSHVVPDSLYLNAMSSLAGTIDTLVIASDSTVPRPLRDAAASFFTTAVFLDKPEFAPHSVHHLLRLAAVHIGSNGQFSLTAGLLGKGLFLRPMKWFGEGTGFDEVLNQLSTQSFSTLAREGY